MKLLERPKATGEVRCGHHRGSKGGWCKKPANHTGKCARGDLSASPICVEGKPQKDEWVHEFAAASKAWRTDWAYDWGAGKDYTAHGIQHPDTREFVEVSEDDFNIVNRATGGSGGYGPEVANIVREVLKKYER